MSRKSKLLNSDEDIMNCILELDVSDAESDLLEFDVMYDSEDDQEYLSGEIEDDTDEYCNDCSDIERPTKKDYCKITQRT